MNPPVLSGTRTPVLSGTADPSYREPKPDLTTGKRSRNRAPNFSNQESFGFLLTALGIVGQRHLQPHCLISLSQRRDDGEARQPHKTRLEIQRRDAKRRIELQEVRRPSQSRCSTFTARQTINVAPELRSHVKIAAFECNLTVAHVLHSLLLNNFPRRKRVGR